MNFEDGLTLPRNPHCPGCHRVYDVRSGAILCRVGVSIIEGRRARMLWGLFYCESDAASANDMLLGDYYGEWILLEVYANADEEEEAAMWHGKERVAWFGTEDEIVAFAKKIMEKHLEPGSGHEYAHWEDQYGFGAKRPEDPDLIFRRGETIAVDEVRRVR